MKKCTGVCYIDSKNKIINAFAIHTANRDVVDFSNALKPHYASIFDLVTYLVDLAKSNNFEIPYDELFGAKRYDIMFIDINTPFTIQRYFIDA